MGTPPNRRRQGIRTTAGGSEKTSPRNPEPGRQPRIARKRQGRVGVGARRPGGHRTSGWRGDEAAREKSPAPRETKREFASS